MLSIFDPIREVSLLSVLVRMLFAFLCGGVIGMERSFKNRPAGFRTHILICIGATVASVTGLYMYLNAHIPVDVSRIGAQVVSGLGFIGGGTIIVTKKKTIKGLTTAAGLWATGIIGLSIGAGYYEGAIVATVLVLVAETIFSRLGAKIRHTPEFCIAVRYRHRAALDQVMRHCKDKRLAISNLQVTAASDEQAPYKAVLYLRPRQTLDVDRLLGDVRNTEGIYSAEQLDIENA